MTARPDVTISRFTAEALADELSAFGELLHACVHDGASISFVLPFTAEDSQAYWREGILPALQGGRLALLVAEQEGRIAGAVQLDCDTPPNQPHRAEVRKLLVHPAFRGRGIARALMVRLERLAEELGRSLLTLDTRSGDKAEPLYLSLGYETVGIIPGYCRDPFGEGLDSTTIMYKRLADSFPPGAPSGRG